MNHLIICSSRRSWMTTTTSSSAAALLMWMMFSTQPATAAAAANNKREPLDELLYRILRVREATQQETRLIRSGKFKDIQRANVKLAVKYMVENYRLNDAFVAAAAYIEGSSARRMEAGQVGSTAVQNLYTILEYFDTSDVQNLKVGTKDSMGADKEELVIRGLEATRGQIDVFLTYFSATTVNAVRARIKEENDLNEKEFDPSLGKIINLPVMSSP